MKTEKTVIGILAGVAVGALLGVLFAPDKGTNTRQKIAKKSSSATDELKGKLESITNTLSEKYNSLVNKGESYIEKEKNNIRA